MIDKLLFHYNWNGTDRYDIAKAQGNPFFRAC